MPKKRAARRHVRPDTAPPARPRKIVVVSLCLLLASAAALGGASALRSSCYLATASLFAQSTPPPLTLSKEYVYAGGRLVATEEPTGATPAAGPTNLAAAATQATQVALSWSPPAAGTVDHYVVERTQNVGSSYVPLTPNPTTTGFTDGTAGAGVSYLYRVKAVFAGGASSGYSNTDLATTVIFTDDPLVAGVTTIKAQHLAELRQAVGAMRDLANLQAATWPDQALPGVPIKAAHVLELRASLDQALAALGLGVPPYTDPALAGVNIKKVHFEELRQRVK